MKLAIILTVRLASERLPGKALLEVAHRPLISWIIDRLMTITPHVILSTTSLSEDNELDAIAARHGIPISHGDNADVITQMETARQRYAPDAEYILRGLGDCPFMSREMIRRSVQILHRTQAEAFRWHLEPRTWPVYGSREFPYDLSGWSKIVKRSTVREHIDKYYHDNPEQFLIAWHEPPPNSYFRPYRLEVDWAEDLELIRAIADGPGMLASVPEITNFLDEHPDIARTNRERVEKTGMTVSYDYRTQRTWMRVMDGQPVITWTDHVWYPPSPKSIPVFCQSGQDLIGFALDGTLYVKSGIQIRGAAKFECPCGAGKFWNEPRNRGFGELSASMVAL